MTPAKATVEDAVTEVISKKYYFLQAGQTEKNPVAVFESARFSALVQKANSASRSCTHIKQRLETESSANHIDISQG